MSGNGLVNKSQYKSAMQSGPLVAPKQLLSNKGKSVAAPAGRNPVYTSADTRMPVTQDNPIIEIKLGNSINQWVDFYRGGIFVKVTLTGNGTYIRPCNLISNMIERFELVDGNTQVEDYLKYGEKYTLDYYLNKEKNGGAVSGFTFYGDASRAERNARHTPVLGVSKTFEYKLPITSEILSKIHAFPNFEPFAKGNDQLILRWYIAKAETWIETDGNVYAWSIGQWDIYKDHLDLDDSVKYQNMLMEGSTVRGTLKYSWVHDDVLIRPLDVTTSQVVQIEQKKSSLQGILVTVRKGADVNNPTINDKFETWYGPQSGVFPLASYQWRMDDKSWPDRPIKTTGPYALEAFRWLTLWKNHDNGEGNLDEIFDISGPQFANDKFIMVLDARTWPQLMGESYNNVSTLRSNNSINLHLEFSSPPPPGLQLVVHTFHDRDWFFGYPGGGKVNH